MRASGQFAKNRLAQAAALSCSSRDFHHPAWEWLIILRALPFCYPGDQMRIRRFRWSGAFAILVFAAELHAASSFSQRPCASPVLAKAGARCGVVEVAENPSKPDRKISLNVIIVPAL